MNRQILHLVFLVWMCLLSSACKNPYSDISLTPDESGIPPKTATGEDIMVCMINANTDLEIYREQSEFLFSSDDIWADRLYTSNIPVIKIAARQRPKDDPSRETHVSLSMRIEDPQVNVAYGVYATYAGPRGSYIADNTTAILRFSRIDSVVASGEFSFIGISNTSDSLRISGYFDIPFLVK
ncbi:hypothetical protein [Polluticoccus soli]|uniref:hypothetical protein n=1 Tax=Polluticoccus soli TaxID=3034150 RepID=UPI0023E1A04B|nr:hypothetical protein [Flavipsychrobacter sp. JY13-12]